MNVQRVPVFDLPITLTPWQQKIDDCSKRFRVIEAGRRSGKTSYAHYWLAKCASEPRTHNWLIGPTYRQVKKISWLELLNFIPKSVIRAIHHSELTIRFINGSMISLMGSDKPDSLRGPRVDNVAFEEAAKQSQRVWFDIMRASIADSMGSAIFFSSPIGINWFHKLYVYAKESENAEWAAFHGTIYDNPHIARSEIETIKKDVSDAVWRQEFLADVTASVGLVYPEASSEHFFRAGERFEDHLKWPCVRGIDWGFSPSDTACVWLHVNPMTGEVVATDEHIKGDWDVSRHANAITTRSHGRIINPGNTVLDQSAFRDEGTSGTSIAKQFNANGIRVVPSTRDRDSCVDIVKRFLVGDPGPPPRPWVYISSACKQLTEDIQTWQHSEHESDVLAAFRYGLVHAYRRGLTAGRSGAPELDNHGPYVDRFGRRLLRRAQQHNQGHSWNFEDGVPE